MSNHPDTYLVEKLREILSRIYKRPSIPPPGRDDDDELIENYSLRFFKDNQWYFDNKRIEKFTNSSLPGSGSRGELVEGQSDDLLRRNLAEFIHVLKMSLIRESSEEKMRDKLSMYTSLSSDPVSGVTDVPDFNLTLDDISDLNRLMDGNNRGMPVKQVLLIISYFMIACVAIIGNALVVQLVIRSRRLHTLTHALLANLAVADLLMATINIPFSAARVIMTEWPFGSFLCQAVPFIQVTSVYVTSITMAVIAVDRYQVIMKPLGHRLKGWEGIVLVVGIWTISSLFSLPFALHHKVVTILTVRVVKRCQAEFTSVESRQWLTVLTFLAQYFVPLSITTGSYASVMHRLGHRSSELGSTTPRQMEAQSRAKRKTIKMLVLTVIFFAVCWAPINIYHLLTHFNVVRHDSTAILFCHLIAMSSSCYNPFIYCWLNEHFRREALKWFRCFRTRRSPLVHPGIEINGMLTRADLVCRRNQSTTMVHTLSFRTHVLPSQNLREHSTSASASANQNPTRGYYPEALFLATTPSATAANDDVFDVDGAEELTTTEAIVVNHPAPTTSGNGSRNFIAIMRSNHSASNLSLQSNKSQRSTSGATDPGAMRDGRSDTIV